MAHMAIMAYTCWVQAFQIRLKHSILEHSTGYLENFFKTLEMNEICNVLVPETHLTMQYEKCALFGTSSHYYIYVPLLGSCETWQPWVWFISTMFCREQASFHHVCLGVLPALILIPQPFASTALHITGIQHALCLALSCPNCGTIEKLCGFPPQAHQCTLSRICCNPLIFVFLVVLILSVQLWRFLCFILEIKQLSLYSGEGLCYLGAVIQTCKPSRLCCLVACPASHPFLTWPKVVTQDSP